MHFWREELLKLTVRPGYRLCVCILTCDIGDTYHTPWVCIITCDISDTYHTVQVSVFLRFLKYKRTHNDIKSLMPLWRRHDTNSVLLNSPVTWSARVTSGRLAIAALAASTWSKFVFKLSITQRKLNYFQYTYLFVKCFPWVLSRHKCTSHWQMKNH